MIQAIGAHIRRYKRCALRTSPSAAGDLHAIARADALHRRACLENNSGGIESWNERKSGLDEMSAGSNIGVHGIDTSCQNFNEYVGLPRTWIVVFVEHELLGTSEGVHTNGLHAVGAASLNCATRSISTHDPNGTWATPNALRACAPRSPKTS